MGLNFDEEVWDVTRRFLPPDTKCGEVCCILLLLRSLAAALVAQATHFVPILLSSLGIPQLTHTPLAILQSYSCLAFALAFAR